MQSPAIEWTLGVGYLLVLDAIRAHGEADNDTASEVVRDLVARHPRGEVLFTGILLVGAMAFRSHIVKPLRSQP